MTNKSIEPFLKAHNISNANYKVMCEQLNVYELTPLERPWVCTRCGFMRLFEESKKVHLEWHERRRQ